jgi:hypothetical protein
VKQAPVYVVNDVPVPEYDPGDPKATFYFKDLTTSSGDKLPVFTKPPNIIPAATRGNFIVTNITAESFRIYQGMIIALPGESDAPKFVKATLIIIQNP